MLSSRANEFKILATMLVLPVFSTREGLLVKHQETKHMAKKNAAPTKSEILAHIAKDTELSRKQVGAVFESLNGIIKKSLKGVAKKKNL